MNLLFHFLRPAAFSFLIPGLPLFPHSTFIFFLILLSPFVPFTTFHAVIYNPHQFSFTHSSFAFVLLFFTFLFYPIYPIPFYHILIYPHLPYLISSYSIPSCRIALYPSPFLPFISFFSFPFHLLFYFCPSFSHFLLYV